MRDPAVPRRTASFPVANRLLRRVVAVTTTDLLTFAALTAPAALAQARGLHAAPMRSAEKLVAELKSRGTAADDNFGSCVAVSGSIIAVGAPDHASDAGRAYIFSKTPTGWQQADEPRGTDTVDGDWFGCSIAIAGIIVVVGAEKHAQYAGRVYVFTKTSKGWRQTAELEGSDSLPNDDFGTSVAVSGSTVVAGADMHGPGRAYLFSETRTGWQEAVELAAPDAAAMALAPPLLLGETLSWLAPSSTPMLAGPTCSGYEQWRRQRQGSGVPRALVRYGEEAAAEVSDDVLAASGGWRHGRIGRR